MAETLHSATDRAKTVSLPDLISAIPYTVHRNPHTDSTTAASNNWFLETASFSVLQERKFCGMNIGYLSGRCYVHCGSKELRNIADFLSFLFCLDDWSDEFDTAGTKGAADCIMNTLYHPSTYYSSTVLGIVINSIWSRMLTSIGDHCGQRFIQTMDLYLQAVYRETFDRELGNIPTVDDYIKLRRDTSACKPSFVMLEYGCKIDLPDSVIEHPVMHELENAANDSVSWQNDIFSFNIEQSKGQTHNLVIVLMDEKGIGYQAAIEQAADMVRDTIVRFETHRARLPSWGPELDKMAVTYIQGLQDWMIDEEDFEGPTTSH
ncbi:hypothetical protein EW026_g600 [Hermanssonia centrifuga]|uniref:Terpene synthase n=1 Tax=Hermanssonia centrifuga TaxID=98765 RepID=A0A4S4KU19_9APHY|nr:hypothetical protein EW026_g600 [Hermanssonia centrifuga]